MPAREAARRPAILVLAGVNGAGKSSVGGALVEAAGLSWYNPDAYARLLRRELGLTVEDSNALAWEHGRALLEAAIRDRRSFALETTLGGTTIRDLLASAAPTHDITVLFVGLASVEQHLARVRARVAAGGHDIPEARIRERWDRARGHLVDLLPQLHRLQVLDNSVEVAPGELIPDPVLVLDVERGRVTFPDPADAAALRAVPPWARPIVEAALEQGAPR